MQVFAGFQKMRDKTWRNLSGWIKLALGLYSSDRFSIQHALGGGSTH